jgi:hypothetical protein
VNRRSSSKLTSEISTSNWAATVIAAKSTGWDENRVFLEGDKLEVEVKRGRRVLTHIPAAPRKLEPLRYYFPDD